MIQTKPLTWVPGEILIFVTVAASKHSRSPKSKELRLRIYVEATSNARHWASRETTSSGTRMINDLSHEACSSRPLLRLSPLVSSHPSEPMVDQRRLPNTGPRHDCNDVDVLLCPSIIQKGDVLLSTKNIASCNG